MQCEKTNPKKGKRGDGGQCKIREVLRETDLNANEVSKGKLSQALSVQALGNPECFLQDYPIQTAVLHFARVARYRGLAEEKVELQAARSPVC
jgi:hypothetical protein